MSTPRKPWPTGYGDYHEMLSATRRVSNLATGIIEYCIPQNNIPWLRRWLNLINAKALKIDNNLKSIYQAQIDSDRRPQWVVDAIKELAIDSVQVDQLSRSALRDLEIGNWEALEKKVTRCMALGLIMEKALLEGPPPETDGDDVLAQVRELVDTLDEEPGDDVPSR